MSIPNIEAPTFDPRYKTLYRLGGIASILSAVLIVFAIGAYLVLPRIVGGTDRI